MSTLDTSERRNLIEAIKTPLGFFCLVILVAEAIFVGLAAIGSGSDRYLLILAATCILVLLILVVAAIAIWKPEALWGKRYQMLEEHFARGLGEELYTVLEGYLANLEAGEREEVLYLLHRTIASSPHARSKTTRKFCAVLVETIVRRAELNGSGKIIYRPARVEHTKGLKRQVAGYDLYTHREKPQTIVELQRGKSLLDAQRADPIE